MPVDFNKLYQNPDEYDEFTKNLTDDIAFFVSEAQKAQGPVLELACGTGRVTLPIARAGVKIVGLDGSPLMLMKAIEKSKAERLPTEWIEADFRDFNLNTKFDLIFFAYHSIHHIQDCDSYARLLECVRNHLSDHGRFIIDSYNPGHPAFELQGNPRPTLEETMTINRVKWFEGDRTGRFDYLYVREIETILTHNGFAVLGQYGDLDLRPYQADCTRVLTLSKKKLE